MLYLRLLMPFQSGPRCLSAFLQKKSRGRAEKEPRISIPVPAVPVSELLAGKSQRICNSLNWFKGVTFTFWIKIYRKNIFPKINSKIYKFSVFFLPEVPIPALPEPESKFLVSVPLTPHHNRITTSDSAGCKSHPLFSVLRTFCLPAKVILNTEVRVKRADYCFHQTICDAIMRKLRKEKVNIAKGTTDPRVELWLPK